MRQQLALYSVYYNFCLPHASLRQPLAQTGAAPQYGLGSAVAALYASHGSWVDRSGVDATRSAPVPGPTVATATSAVVGS